MNQIRVGIIGATGYTGSELVRILVRHPGVQIVAITSERRAGERFSDIHPYFQGIVDTVVVKAEDVPALQPDVVFLGLPHGTSMEYVRKYANAEFKIIDLSGDFRLNSAESYLQWYNAEHVYPRGLEHAVYGLPELFASEIQSATLVANPGCYPTSAILALAPLVTENIIDPLSLIIDSKSGITGAGIKPKAVTHYSAVSDNFKAYGLKTHRHTIEIQEQLASKTDATVQLQFTPHLLPVDRGILSTSYAKPNRSVDQSTLQTLYDSFYTNAPFVRMCKAPPSIKDVRGSNFCNIHIDYDDRTNTIIVISVIDNLVKGAAGQAVQNMNIMFGLHEESGLQLVPINP